MVEAVIHNGVIVQDVPGVSTEAQPAEQRPRRKDEPDPDIDPESIAAAMAKCISEGIAEKLLPMEIVNRLFLLKGPAGKKIVWSRLDLFNIFGLHSQKIGGSK